MAENRALNFTNAQYKCSPVEFAGKLNGHRLINGIGLGFASLAKGNRSLTGWRFGARKGRGEDDKRY